MPPGFNNRSLAHARGLARALVGTSRIARVSTRANGIALFFARDLDRARACNLYEVAALVGDLVSDLDRARYAISNPDHDADIAHARLLACDLIPFLDEARARDRAPGLDLDLDFNVSSVNKDIAHLVGRLESINASRMQGAVPPEPGSRRRRKMEHKRHQQVSIDRTALRVTGLAVWCLPAGWRARYREEYHAQLSDLARVSRRAQWHCAVNFLLRSWSLRRVTLQAVPRRWFV